MGVTDVSDYRFANVNVIRDHADLAAGNDGLDGRLL